MSRKSKKQPRSKPVPTAGGGESLPAPAGIAAANPARRNWEVAGICALLAVMVFIVYGQTTHFEFFNYDDNLYVYQNPVVNRGLSAGRIWQAFIHRDLDIWNPLVTISHMVDWQLYGANAGGHHLTNVLLHLASTILLFLVLRGMTGTLWRSAFVAALFAIHPLRVESVAWIAERKDVLSGLFFMLTLGAYARYAQRPGSLLRYLAVIFLFACGLMSKPMLVTLPFVLLLLDYWPLNRLFQPSTAGRFAVNRRAIVEKIPLLALSLVSCVATVVVPKAAGAAGQVVLTGHKFSLDAIPFWSRIAEAPVWYVTYLGQMFWPGRMAVIYTHYEQGLSWWPAALALLALLSAGIFLLRGRHPWLWVGWLWNLGMLVPVIGIVQISRHSRADHYNYLPQIGLYIALAWLAADWAGGRRPRRIAAGCAGAVLLCFLTAAAFRQASYWRDSLTLWTRTLECTTGNFLAENNLGHYLVEQGRTQEAMAHYRAALDIAPEFVLARVNLGAALLKLERTQEAIAQFHAVLLAHPSDLAAHNNLGAALLKLGQTKDAIAQFNESLKIDPSNSDAHYNLGGTLLDQGMIAEAIPHLRAALEDNPDRPDARSDLGYALLQQGQTDEAVAQYREAVRINPASAEYLCNLGNALFQQGRAEEAITDTQKGLSLDPSNPSVKNSLAWMLAVAPQASLRNGAKAVELATQANHSTGGNDPNILHTLAAACAEAGKFPDAVQTANKALQLAVAQSNTALADSLRREIKLYEAGHKYEDAH